MLYMIFIAALLCIADGIQIEISSDSLKSINDWDKTEPYLMGLHTRWVYWELYQKYDYQTQLSEQYGVKMLAWNLPLGTGILPKLQSDAISKAGTTDKLKNYIWTTEACDVFQSSGQHKIWGDEYLTQKTDIKTYLYAMDSCHSNQYPQLSHCAGVDDTNGWGCPVNDDYWWNYMFIGNIRCQLQIDPNLKYWHIWNEPDTYQNWDLYGKDGDDYAVFYYDVAKAIKYFYPDVILAGPVTYRSPVNADTFKDWFVPLMKLIVSTGRYDILDYLDYHIYSYYKQPYSPWARYDMILSAINTVSLYWNGLTNGERGFIRSQLTETNVALTDEQVSDPDTYWKLRVIENAKQIMALSHNTDKLHLRLQYTMGEDDSDVEHYGWLPYTDMHMQEIMNSVQDGYPIYFKFTDGVKDGYPSYDNGKGIMAQTIYNDTDDTITVVLINYETYSIDVTLWDKDGKIIWDTTAKYAQRWGPFDKDVSITYGTTKATVKCFPQSITAVTGSYKSNPSTHVNEYEFGPMDETQIMKDVGYQTNSVDFTVNIPLNTIPDGLVSEYSYIKFGMLYGAVTEFKWTIKVKVGSTTYFTKDNYINTRNYSQFDIPSSAFLNKITKGNTINIQFLGTRTASIDHKSWEPQYVYGRISFASLVVGGSIKSSYIKVTNGVNLNKWYYAASLSNIPSGIKIAWIKMKSSSQTAWQLGTYNSENYLFEWKSGPYIAPFDFMIRSYDGQTIYSWGVIDSLSNKDSGVMTQTFGAAYTEDADGNESGMGAAEYVAMVISLLIVTVIIGVCIYLVIKKRKMNSQKEEIKDDDSEIMDEHNNNDGSYDMSPIDETQTNAAITSNGNENENIEE